MNTIVKLNTIHETKDKNNFILYGSLINNKKTLVVINKNYHVFQYQRNIKNNFKLIDDKEIFDRSKPISTQICDYVVQLSSDGFTMITAGTNGIALHTISLNEKNKSKSLFPKMILFETQPISFAFHSNNCIGLVITQSGTISSVEFESEKKVKLVNTHSDSVISTCSLKNIKIFFSLSNDKTMRIWYRKNINYIQQIVEYKMGNQTPILIAATNRKIHKTKLTSLKLMNNNNEISKFLSELTSKVDKESDQMISIVAIAYLKTNNITILNAFDMKIIQSLNLDKLRDEKIKTSRHDVITCIKFVENELGNILIIGDSYGYVYLVDLFKKKM